MNTKTTNPIDLDEFCRITLLPVETINTIVEYGIIDPEGNAPEQWRFSVTMVTTTRRALRLHNDLDIDWPGIALAISLLDEVENLRESNRALERRLQRFMHSV